QQQIQAQQQQQQQQIQQQPTSVLQQQQNQAPHPPSELAAALKALQQQQQNQILQQQQNQAHSQLQAQQPQNQAQQPPQQGQPAPRPGSALQPPPSSSELAEALKVWQQQQQQQQQPQAHLQLQAQQQPASVLQQQHQPQHHQARPQLQSQPQPGSRPASALHAGLQPAPSPAEVAGALNILQQHRQGHGGNRPASAQPPQPTVSSLLQQAPARLQPPPPSVQTPPPASAQPPAPAGQVSAGAAASSRVLGQQRQQVQPQQQQQQQPQQQQQKQSQPQQQQQRQQITKRQRSQQQQGKSRSDPSNTAASKARRPGKPRPSRRSSPAQHKQTVPSSGKANPAEKADPEAVNDKVPSSKVSASSSMSSLPPGSHESLFPKADGGMQSVPRAASSGTMLPVDRHQHGHPDVEHASSTVTPPDADLTKWTLEQAEAHVKHLKESKLPVPRQIFLLISNLRRREEKRSAKRLANRKSAQTSRLRKKEETAHLRRLASILNHLPDPILVLSETSRVTFCNLQAERVLGYEANELTGANMEDITAPRSRIALGRLVRDLILLEQCARSTVVSTVVESERGDALRGGSGSERSFPQMLEVTAKAGRVASGSGAGGDISDLSGNPTGKSGAGDANSSNGESSDSAGRKRLHDDSRRGRRSDSASGKEEEGGLASERATSDSQEQSGATSGEDSRPADADVKGRGYSSQESGYVESNESPGDSGDVYSSDDLSSSRKRRKMRPLAPSCSVCLIRSDLRTIRCEITASIRTKPLECAQTGQDAATPSKPKKGNGKNSGSSSNGSSYNGSSSNGIGASSLSEPSDPGLEEKELLLCFRPFQEGEKVGEHLRFRPGASKRKSDKGKHRSSASIRREAVPNVSSSCNNLLATATAEPASSAPQAKAKWPLKKRKFELE
ncbi:hypothetical protein ACHAWF_008232, partial [Thalassiosira exigua]